MNLVRFTNVFPFELNRIRIFTVDGLRQNLIGMSC